MLYEREAHVDLISLDARQETRLMMARFIGWGDQQPSTEHPTTARDRLGKISDSADFPLPGAVDRESLFKGESLMFPHGKLW